MWVVHRPYPDSPLRASYLDAPKRLSVGDYTDHYTIIVGMGPNDYTLIGWFKSWMTAESELVRLVEALADGEDFYRVEVDV